MSKRGRTSAPRTPATEPERDEATEPERDKAPEPPPDAAVEADPSTASQALAEPAPLIDVVPDDLALARAQIDSGLPGLAEGTLTRRIAWLEAGGLSAADELDAARVTLAEALWRQQRPMAARAALDGVRPVSPQRRRPIAMLVEAEALAAAGEPDRATGVMERVVSAIGVDEAWRLRGGVPSRLPWPLPSELRPEPRRMERPPWGQGPPPATQAAEADEAQDGARTAAAHARLEAARAAYATKEMRRGDDELSLAVRLDPEIATEGVALIEGTLDSRPASERLLLYGDLLRAAGRESEAHAAYDRAAEARG